MATITPLLNIQIPTLADDASIEEAVHPFANEFEKYTVMRFANASARDTTITAPVQGMTTYITGTNTLEIHNGSAWIVVGRTGGWSTYTPSFNSTGGALGNATLAGRYSIVNKTADISIQFVVGSTTSFGSSTIAFGNFPVAPRATDWQAAAGWAYDTSAGQGFPISALFEGTSNLRPVCQDGNVISTLPFTWNTGDFIVISLRYEVA